MSVGVEITNRWINKLRRVLVESSLADECCIQAIKKTRNFAILISSSENGHACQNIGLVQLSPCNYFG